MDYSPADPMVDHDKQAALVQARKLGAHGIVGIVFTAVGLPMLIAGLVWGGFVMSSLVGSETTQGTVIGRIAHGSDQSIGESSNRTYVITVRYTVDGHDYEYTPSGGQSPAPSVGDTVTVHYRADDPSDAILGGTAGIVEWVGPGVLTLLGVVFGALGVGFWIWRVRTRRRDIAVIETGDRLTAVVEAVRSSVSTDSEGSVRTVWTLVARYDDPMTGRVHRFTHAYSGVPSVTPPEGDRIVVFVDPADREKYVVAVP
ncbi:hypothetical protein nbrc107696_39930 [Gordonia spumicola]|uniref:DUF3592 domain-containing protein n=1 Tax=Gordonia spumicola TaxID=589161 RepID=A0A7I9VE02_9ACTN|nr:DUF3592 domain-containing protein [Gordonia spumicola]GEE03547.1 hypothetical protein nbrc107696_39930 [Gordonia spumicola]